MVSISFSSQKGDEMLNINGQLGDWEKNWLNAKPIEIKAKMACLELFKQGVGHTKAAKELGLKTVAFTGGSGGESAKLADVAIIAPSSVTCHIQEMHIAAGHQVCGLVEAALAADGE